MTVLVTGANGFVGRALCKRLLAEGLKVRGTIRSSRDAASLASGVSPVFVRDIGPDTDWSEALENVQSVVHLAARVHMTRDLASDPLQAFRRVNVLGSVRLAIMARAAGVTKFVYLSSVKVNGEGGMKPYTERDAPAPEDAYGTSKLESEHALRDSVMSSGMGLVILRPPLVYGPGVKANFLTMLLAIDRGIPFPFASIRNQRSLIYLDNLLDALLVSILHKKADGQTYLVSDGDDISTPDLLRRLAAALGVRVSLFPVPLWVMRSVGVLAGKGNTIRRITGSLTIDSSKIRRELSWRPPFSLDHGLQETADWFKRSRAYSKGERP